MKSAVLSFVLAALVTALLTPLVRRAALKVGAVDEPAARRVHARRVPRLGGLAMAAGFFVPLILLRFLRTHAGDTLFSSPRVTVCLVTGSLMVLALGLQDDIRGVAAKKKLLVQVLAACVAYAGGMHIDGINIPLMGEVRLGWLALPATVAWVVGVVNAINLVDGLDGLAAGIVFFASVTNFAIASMTGNVFILLITASLGGAVVGFLVHNFNPARIFMGDSGSMFLGFTLASASLLGVGVGSAQKTPTLLAISVPILALGLPIMDMLLTIGRRFLSHRSIFVADREHIHHRLLDMGLTHKRAVLALYSISIVFTFSALVVRFGQSWQIGTALIALAGLLIGVFRFAGYFNSSLAASALRGEELCQPLRRAVPSILLQMSGDATSDRLTSLLAAFGQEAGMLAIGIKNSANAHLPAWRWESPSVSGRSSLEATCATFPVDKPGTLEIQFFFDTAAGVVGPQTCILLQLVADGAGRLLASRADTATSPQSGEGPAARDQRDTVSRVSTA